MHQRRGIEGGALVGTELPTRHLPQFAIQHRQHAIERTGVAVACRSEPQGDIGGVVHAHTLQSSAQTIGHNAPDSSSQRRSEEHTSELQSLMRISYAVFCLKKKT